MIGIMQGRLTEPKGRGIQFFPFENWKNEFYDGADIGVNEIEWIFDYENYEENPLWTKNGIKAVKTAVRDSGISINAVCFDYFMRYPFYKADAEKRIEYHTHNLNTAYRILEAMAEVNAKILEVPLVDASSIKCVDEEQMAIEYIEKIAEYGAGIGIKIGLETDYAPGSFSQFLKKFEGSYIYANFDSGNSSGLGYDAVEEIHSLGDRIYNVHIKDRVYHGTTVQLGTGSADFDKVFSSLKSTGYKNSYILQAARGREGLEKKNIKNQINFVQSYMKKYQLP